MFKIQNWYRQYAGSQILPILMLCIGRPAMGKSRLENLQPYNFVPKLLYVTMTPNSQYRRELSPCAPSSSDVKLMRVARLRTLSKHKRVQSITDLGWSSLSACFHGCSSSPLCSCDNLAARGVEKWAVSGVNSENSESHRSKPKQTILRNGNVKGEHTGCIVVGEASILPWYVSFIFDCISWSCYDLVQCITVNWWHTAPFKLSTVVHHRACIS